MTSQTMLRFADITPATKHQHPDEDRRLRGNPLGAPTALAMQKAAEQPMRQRNERRSEELRVLGREENRRILPASRAG